MSNKCSAIYLYKWTTAFNQSIASLSLISNKLEISQVIIMALSTRTGKLLLLLAGILLLTVTMLASGAEACPQYCLDVAYTTCTASGDKQLKTYCNCCLLEGAMPNAGNCTLHLSDGTQQSCS